MRLLALDQASITSGYSIWDDDKLIKYGKFKINNDDFGERLHLIRKTVKDLIIEYEVDKVLMEDIQLQDKVAGKKSMNNVQTFKKLAEVFGVIYELTIELNVPCDAVLATVWKSKVGIKGADRPAQKRNAQKHVEEIYGAKVTQDEADAICIGEYASKISEEDEFDWTF